MHRGSPKRLRGSLFKLTLILAGVFTGFYLLFDLVPANRHEIHAGVLRLVAARPAQSLEPGPRIIFRLDDVEQGVREDQVFAVLSLFEDRGVPVEVGIVPRANGSPSFALSGLKSYLAKGVIDISVHGVTHIPNEFLSAQTGMTRDTLATGLREARRQILKYYGVHPVAFLVPYDVFDENGYDAVREAGFQILSSQWRTDPHRGTTPVDFGSRPRNDGLFRLPAADDAVAWDSNRQRWGEFQPMSNLLFSIRTSLEELNVAVISLHPAAFETRDGGVDAAKLDDLEKLIEEAGSLGRISTFRNWYCSVAIAAAAPGRTSEICQ